MVENIISVTVSVSITVIIIMIVFAMIFVMINSLNHCPNIIKVILWIVCMAGLFTYMIGQLGEITLPNRIIFKIN